MKSNLEIISKEIARDLENTYYNYYMYVCFSFIVEAVENTLKDFKMEIPHLSKIHSHIKENYFNQFWMDDNMGRDKRKQ